MASHTAYETHQGLLNGTYRFVSNIQKGSFGKVTLAENVKTGKKFALKAMLKSSKEVARMARHETAILKLLGSENPHICQLVDDFETDEYFVLVLEYCENGDMYDLIHAELTSHPRAVDVWKLAREMYLGLSYAHSKGIYHRDLKPENILFTLDGSVKICDWGLATRSRYLKDFNIGTEKYMAPELFANSALAESSYKIDCRYTDYWSFGVTLLTAVFGTSPFKPVRPNDDVWGSADTFRRKNKSVKKSLESDYNFKNFVYYNKPEVLYDIYPSMNENCFRIFTRLLKVGGDDEDIDSYVRKIERRDLDAFIRDLEDNWKYGLTVWEEDELYAVDDDGVEDLFDMDGFTNSTKRTEYEEEEEETEEKTETSESFVGARAVAAVEVPLVKQHSIPVPSLVESTYQPKLWYDLEDELDDTEFNKLFSSLSTKSVTPMPIEESNKSVGDDGRRNIRIVEKEVMV